MPVFVLCMRMVMTSLYQLSHVVNLTEDAIGSVTIHLAVNECNHNRYKHQLLLAEQPSATFRWTSAAADSTTSVAATRFWSIYRPHSKFLLQKLQQQQLQQQRLQRQ